MRRSCHHLIHYWRCQNYTLIKGGHSEGTILGTTLRLLEPSCHCHSNSLLLAFSLIANHTERTARPGRSGRACLAEDWKLLRPGRSVTLRPSVLCPQVDVIALFHLHLMRLTLNPRTCASSKWVRCLFLPNLPRASPSISRRSFTFPPGVLMVCSMIPSKILVMSLAGRSDESSTAQGSSWAGLRQPAQDAWSVDCRPILSRRVRVDRRSHRCICP